MSINQRVAVAAEAGGLLLGCLDFVWIKYVPYPLGGLGNSPAVWAAAAFCLTYLLRCRAVPGVIAAAALLVVAVPSYYLAATVIQHDAVANMYDRVALLWMAFGVVAGIVFGGAGVLARRPGRWQLAALAMPAAVLFAEAALMARRVGDPSYGTGPAWSALIAVAVGLLITFALVSRWRRRAAALLLALPLAGVGFALFSVASFG